MTRLLLQPETSKLQKFPVTHCSVLAKLMKSTCWSQVSKVWNTWQVADVPSPPPHNPSHSTTTDNGLPTIWRVSCQPDRWHHFQRSLPSHVTEKGVKFLLSGRRRRRGRKKKEKKSRPYSKLVACLHSARNYELRIASGSGTCGHNTSQSNAISATDFRHQSDQARHILSLSFTPTIIFHIPLALKLQVGRGIQV